MEILVGPAEGLDPGTAMIYRRAVRALNDAGVPFLVGGAYALAPYTGIVRHTKDFDIFVKLEDYGRVVGVLAGEGFRTELTFPHWLGKAYDGESFIDIIFSSGNGVAIVDDGWFTHARDGVVLGEPVKLIPREEMIWSKSFVQERERYDGADVAHLLRTADEHFDWRRLVDRFGPRWRVLYAHLVLFGFVYPAERHRVPAWVMQELGARLEAELHDGAPTDGLCQGTLLSRAQYLIDLDAWSYRDGRLEPDVRMTERDIARWTSAIHEED